MAIKKASEEQERPQVSVHKENGKKKSSRLDQIYEKLKVLKAAQKFYFEQETAKPTVDLDIAKSRHRVSHDSDWHIGHPASETTIIEEKLKNALTKSGMSLNFYDDPNDGSKAGGGGNHEATTDQPALMKPGKQFKLWGEMMTELQKHGRLGAVVDGTLQHPGWAKALGYDPYETIPALEDRVVDNGGVITYHYPDNSVEKIIAYHNAGSGGSDQNPLSANKKRLAEHDGDGTTVVSGHNHGRYGWEQDVNSKGDVVFTGIATGTVKGIKREHQDPFMQDANFAARGAGVVTIHGEMDGERQVVPTLHQSDSDKIWEGWELLERAEKYGLTDEIIAGMKEKLHDTDPKFTFQRYGPHDSRLKEEHFGQGTEGKTPHWTRLVYETTARLPIQIYPVNNLGAGSSTSDMKLLKETVLKEATGNSHVLVAFLRLLVAKDTPKDPDRVAIVENLIEELQGVPGLFKNEGARKMKTVSVLYDSALRSEKWKANIGPTTDENGEYDLELAHRNEQFYAATAISDGLGAPMLDNKGETVIRTRAGNVSIVTHDRLGNSGSLDKALSGLRRMEMRHIEQGGEPHDVVMGGHMPIAAVAELGGVKIIGTQAYVAPGHFSEFVEMGKGNAQIASAPGQSIIILPNGTEKTVVVKPNFLQSKKVMDMLTLEEGARQTDGIEKWKEKLGRKGKRTYSIPK